MGVFLESSIKLDFADATWLDVSHGVHNVPVMSHISHHKRAHKPRDVTGRCKPTTANVLQFNMIFCISWGHVSLLCVTISRFFTTLSQNLNLIPFSHLGVVLTSTLDILSRMYMCDLYFKLALNFYRSKHLQGDSFLLPTSSHYRAQPWMTNALLITCFTQNILPLNETTTYASQRQPSETW